MTGDSQDRQWLKLAARILGVLFLTVLIQITVISQVTVFGVSADATPLLAIFIGLLAGSAWGASAGFCIGLSVDIALLQTLGFNALLFSLVGYAAGRLRETRDPDHVLLPVFTALVGVFFIQVGGALLQFLLGVDAPVSPLLIRQGILITVVSALIALPIHAAVRKALASELPDRRRRRKHRSYGTTGLSPLSGGKR